MKMILCMFRNSKKQAISLPCNQKVVMILLGIHSYALVLFKMLLYIFSMFQKDSDAFTTLDRIRTIKSTNGLNEKKSDVHYKVFFMWYLVIAKLSKYSLEHMSL
jgi:hypothetical protein